MAFPIVRHQDAEQVGMIAEADAEQIEDFALVPVGAAPDAGDRIDLGIGARQRGTSRAGARLRSMRVQVVDDFEARLGGIPVDRGDRAQADELLVVLQEAADAGDFRRRDFERQFAEFELAAA